MFVWKLDDLEVLSLFLKFCNGVLKSSLILLGPGEVDGPIEVDGVIEGPETDPLGELENELNPIPFLKIWPLELPVGVTDDLGDFSNEGSGSLGGGVGGGKFVKFKFGDKLFESPVVELVLPETLLVLETTDAFLEFGAKLC